VRGYRLKDAPAGFEAAGDAAYLPQVFRPAVVPLEIQRQSRIADFPPQARAYVAGLERSLAVPIDGVSVGPERAALALP
jgi:adenylosuccinate synthase